MSREGFSKIFLTNLRRQVIVPQDQKVLKNLRDNVENRADDPTLRPRRTGQHPFRNSPNRIGVDVVCARLSDERLSLSLVHAPDRLHADDADADASTTPGNPESLCRTRPQRISLVSLVPPAERDRILSTGMRRWRVSQPIVHGIRFLKSRRCHTRSKGGRV